MSQFFSQSYLKPQYFNMNYLHGATAVPSNDGKSGYWRLFYYNLQEEALKKDEQVKGKAEAEGKSESAKKEPVVAQPARKSKPKRMPVQAGEAAVDRPADASDERPPVHQRPIYRRHESLPDILPFLNVLSLEFRSWVLSSEPLVQLMLQRKAANDAELEDDEDLLLLAA